MSVKIVTGQAMERTGVILMARILGNGGVPITRATLSALSYEVGYVDVPAELRPPLAPLDQAEPVRTSEAAIDLPVADAIYDQLQIGPAWSVVAAAPAAVGDATLFVEPLKGALPAGKTLDYGTGTATLSTPAAKGDRVLSATITGNIAAGDGAIAGTPRVPPASPWKVDGLGYNFRLDLGADALAEIPLEQYPTPRYYVASVQATPAEGAGATFGWEYRLETTHRLYGKWQP